MFAGSRQVFALKRQYSSEMFAIREYSAEMFVV
jgi:hypothetical protein